MLKKWSRNPFPPGPGNYCNDNDKSYQKKPECTFVLIRIRNILFCNTAPDGDKCDGDQRSYRMFNHPKTNSAIFHHVSHSTRILYEFVAPVANEPLDKTENK